MVHVQLVDPRGALLPQSEVVETQSFLRRYSADRYTYESYSLLSRFLKVKSWLLGSLHHTKVAVIHE